MKPEERIGRDIAHEWGIKYEGNEKVIEGTLVFGLSLLSFHIGKLGGAIMSAVSVPCNWIVKAMRKT